MRNRTTPKPDSTVPRRAFARAPRAATALALFALLCLLIGSGVAQGEIAKKGNVLVSFGANLSPSRLPRTKPVSVGVQVGGRVRTTDRSAPPTLKRIILEINRHGRLFSRGLPICNPSRLRGATSDNALATCGAALVGRGSATTQLSLPGQGTFAELGKMLAFNTKVKGRPAIIAHIAGGRKLQLTYMVLFRIRRVKKGQFGTILVANVPSIAGGQGRMAGFNLSLRRNFRFRGRRVGYMNANCPLPKGFRLASVPLARVTYKFDDGRSVGGVLRRVCKVRGR